MAEPPFEKSRRSPRASNQTSPYTNSAEGTSEEVESPGNGQLTVPKSDGNGHLETPSSGDIAGLGPNALAPRKISEWRLCTISNEGGLPHVVQRTEMVDPGPEAYPRWEPTPDEFFHLYASLERSAGGRRVLGVTSAITGEGKTTVALHLALSAVRSTYLRVCLVDLSLGEDDLCRRIGVAPAPSGVIPYLEAESIPGMGGGGQFALLDCGGEAGQLTVIPAAGTPKNAARAARSPRVGALIEALRDEYDLVIVDLPAISTDNALPLVSLLDGTVVVARAAATPRGVIQAGLDRIGRENIVGLVMNRVTSALPKIKVKKG